MIAAIMKTEKESIMFSLLIQNSLSSGMSIMMNMFVYIGMEKNGHKILFFGGPIRHKILITKNKRKKKKREWTEIARTE